MKQNKIIAKSILRHKLIKDNITAQHPKKHTSDHYPGGNKSEIPTEETREPYLGIFGIRVFEFEEKRRPLISTSKTRLLWGTCRSITGGTRGVGVSSVFLFFPFFSFGSYYLLAKGDGDSLLLVALFDETATVLAVGLGDEGKRRPFYQWLSSTKENAELSLYRWLSETGGLTRGMSQSLGELIKRNAEMEMKKWSYMDGSRGMILA
ncbi:hypothetical protein F2Q68_00021946 [Brassica cretica]|uniref:Uncharacterized protein n=1 Tax=Brassica cretica TaxID=69181 RepID=A0A8S9FX42_BRACR|nr:hypothetical protein F2Q68_00021946 [Brassica cretica]